MSTVEEARERLRVDTPFWARHCATILDPRRRPVKLVARPWQARTSETPAHVTPLDEALELQRAAGRPMRAIILKARKLGFSTWVQAKFMQRVTQWPFQAALTVAHRRDSARVLFDMAKLMFDRLPTEEELGLGFSIRPQWIGGTQQARQTGGWMALGDRSRPSEASLYETLTAGAKGGGRAATPSMVHASEVAHWEDPDYLTGLMNALPMEPETIAVLESTANGFNHFADLWDTAVRGAEDPETGVVWTPLFYGWQDNPHNALPFMTDQARDRFERTVGDPDGGGDEEEVWLVEQFGVTLEQLNWRRAVLHGPECQGKLEMFHQEHPATPEQAFIGTGQPVFSQILVSRAIKEAQAAPEPVAGLLRGVDFRERRTRSGTVRVPTRVVWVPPGQETPEDLAVWGPDERLLVWEHPRRTVEEVQEELERRGRLRSPDVIPGVEAELEQAAAERASGQYVVFADVAVGQGNTAGVGDWHAVQVLDHVTRQQVARYRSRIDVHDLPMVLFLIATYYNGAWLAPEVNGPGIGVVDTLKRDLRYPRLYRRRRAGDDMRTDQREQLVGWMTDLRTKPLMEQTFGQALKEGTHGLRDVHTGREFTTYVEDPKNPARHGARKGAHDDLAVAFMGAHRIAAELRPRDPSVRRSVRGRTVSDDITGY